MLQRAYKRKKEKQVCFWPLPVVHMWFCHRYRRRDCAAKNPYYRKRGSASYIVREVRSVRERERERERKRSDVTLVALKLAVNFAPFLAKIFTLVLAKSFALFLAKNCTLVYPLLKGAEFTRSVAKNVALFETVCVLRFASVKWRDRGSKHHNKRSSFRLHRPSPHQKTESN